MQRKYPFPIFSISMVKSFGPIIRQGVERFATRIWESPGFWTGLLFPLSLLFAATAYVRRLSFKWGLRRVEYLDVPVIVVGNVRVGGTGKTPIVIALVAALRAAGWKPGVILRGYGVRFSGTRCVQIHDAPDQVGDEPLLIAQRTQAPVWIGADRVAAGRALRATHPDVDVIISDDGLQHYRLGRDIELVVFDERLGGNGYLLPAGPLREPLNRQRHMTLVNQNENSRLKASATLLQQVSRQSKGAPAFAVRLKTGLAWRLVNPLEHRPLHSFTDQKVWAAAGIGAPERFFDSIRRHGIQPITHALPDHFVYSASTFSQVKAQVILITEKDAVKCQAVLANKPDARLWAVPVDALLEPQCIEFLLDTLRKCSKNRSAR